MAYQALYRKWRPKSFEEILGQTATVKTLRKQVESGHIAHAYLFCGCRGTGKTSIAKIMSRAINCQNPHHGDPCGECESCRNIMNDMSMDVVEMDAASNSRVDDMRDLLEQAAYPPQMEKYKVYIIDEVHMLSASAFNALLKTIEEPPKYLVFILATTDPQKIPATILSRVQRFDFGRIPTHLMVQRMTEALSDMQLTAEEEALQIVARSAEGAMRDAFSILDMCASSAENGVIRAELVRDLLGTSDKEILFSFMNAIAQRDSGLVIRKIDEIMRMGKEPLIFLKDLSAHCRCLLTVKNVRESVTDILAITPEEEKSYRDQAELFSSERLLSLLDLLMTAEGSLKYSAFPRIGLETALLRACQPNVGEDSSALTERISELENELKGLQKKIAEGLVTAPPAPVQEVKAEKKKTPAEGNSTPSSPAKPKELSADREFWAKATKTILRSMPACTAFIRKIRFLGSQDGVLQLVVDEAEKTSFEYLNAPARKTSIAEALKETAGQDVPFVLRLSGREEKVSETGTEQGNEQIETLANTFGRENIQVVEGK